MYYKIAREKSRKHPILLTWNVIIFIAFDDTFDMIDISVTPPAVMPAKHPMGYGIFCTEKIISDIDSNMYIYIVFLSM